MPDAISVVGFDDHPIADIWNPGLNTYRQDFARAGRAAVELLLERIDAERAGRALPARKVDVPGEIVIRESATALGAARSGSPAGSNRG